MKPESPGDSCHLLRIVLVDVEPAIWRELMVPSAIRLDRLHAVIQVAMGWENEHLHEFVVGTMRDGRRFGPRRGSGDSLFGAPDTEDEGRFTLAQIAPSKGNKFRYVYDFGDDWQHQISVKSVVPADPSLKLPCCIGAARTCPPEDCGGPWRYPEMLLALADPLHEDHEETLDWIGDEFDPEAVDLDRINAELSDLAARWARATPARRKKSG